MKLTFKKKAIIAIIIGPIIIIYSLIKISQTAVFYFEDRGQVVGEITYSHERRSTYSVEYNYEVDGNKLKGKDQAFWWDKPKSSDIWVYYLKSNPQKSIIPKFALSNMILWMSSLILLIPGIFILILGLMGRLPNKAQKKINALFIDE